MTVNDEIIFEQYFPSINLTTKERNFIINVLLNSKEIEDSAVSINDKSDCSYYLNFLRLNRDGNRVVFDGIITNASENRMINGTILKIANKLAIFFNVYRCSDVVEEDDKEYSFSVQFDFKSDKVIRKTRYLDGRYFEAEVETDLFDETEVEEFIQNKTEQLKLQR